MSSTYIFRSLADMADYLESVAASRLGPNGYQVPTSEVVGIIRNAQICPDSTFKVVRQFHGTKQPGRTDYASIATADAPQAVREFNFNIGRSSRAVNLGGGSDVPSSPLQRAWFARPNSAKWID